MTQADSPVPILMYHSIGASTTPSYRRFAVDPAMFAQHLDFLAGAGYQTLTMSELADLRRKAAGPARLPARTVVLTFDDGFADFYTEALPALRRHGFTATLYVITGYVGGRSEWLAADGEGDRPILSWSQLREIAASGIECAAHSDTHPQLDALPTGLLRRELSRPKRVLEDRLQHAVRTFAYPFGYYSRRVRHLVEEAGYRSACTVHDLVATARDDLFAVPRLTVDGATDVAGLARLLGQPPPTALDRGIVAGKRLVWQGLRRHGPRRLAVRAPGTAAGSVAGSVGRRVPRRRSPERQGAS